MRCIITGCALVVDDAWIAGDLYTQGAESDSLIFVGNQQNGEACWLYNKPISYSKRLAPAGLWEKRGVFIILKVDANLNQAALEYLGADRRLVEVTP